MIRITSSITFTTFATLLSVTMAAESVRLAFWAKLNYFESVGDLKKVAAARVEIAYCYWREGELNEARIMLREALKKLTTEGDTRARAILKLATVELSATRYTDALKLLTDNQSLFEN